ncbi:MAG TPA: SDR family NAD(P)-dependent oxidoreductase [Fodinibius sp.]|nr:SDR family NAD(P)-dependent oxidoreductase [Fodinibius sp.]
MDFDFNKGHIIITGGTGALGTAVTAALLEAGAKCSIPSHSSLNTHDFKYAEHENCFLQPEVDLTDENDTQQFFAQAISEQGPLWASIHTAGGFGTGTIEDADAAAFMHQFKLNTLSCYNSCRAAIQWMRKSDYNTGRIVNVAARPALEPRQGKNMSAYAVSKAGVLALTQSLAEEVANDSILVNAIAPSIFDTPQNRASMPDADFDQWQKPEQVARQILHLASPANEVVSGAVVPVYGIK